MTQILREINFGDSRRSRFVVFVDFEVLNFDFGECLHFAGLNST